MLSWPVNHSIWKALLWLTRWTAQTTTVPSDFTSLCTTHHDSEVQAWCLTVLRCNIRIWLVRVIYLSGLFTGEWSQVLLLSRTTHCIFHNFTGLLLSGSDNDISSNKSKKSLSCHGPQMVRNNSISLAFLPMPWNIFLWYSVVCFYQMLPKHYHTQIVFLILFK